MRAAERSDRPPDDPRKRESPGQGALSDAIRKAGNEGQSNRTSTGSLYRKHPGCALLVKRTVLRCGGRIK